MTLRLSCLPHAARRVLALASLAVVTSAACSAEWNRGALECTSPPCDVARDGGTSSSDATGGFRDEDASLPDGDAVPTLQDEATSRANCFDGDDNNGDGTTDCADTSCGVLPSCCVGSGESACCEPEAVPAAALSFADCTGSELSTCEAASVLTAFGAPAPRVRVGEDFAFLPGGDEQGDSGAYIDSPIDLTTHRVSVEATFGLPDDCSSTCLEAAAIGLTAQDSFGSSTLVAPVVGLLLSGARGTMSFILDGAVAESWALGDERDRYGFVAKPTGELEVTRNGTSLLGESLGFEPVHAARLVLYGRNRNDAGTAERANASIGSVNVSAALCDVPWAWADRAKLTLRRGGAVWSPDFARGSSIGVDPASGRRLLAFESGGSIYLAEEPGDDPTDWVLVESASNLPLEGRDGMFDAGGLSEPAIVYDGAGWVIFYAALGEDGVTRIGRARIDGEALDLEADELPVLDPASIAGAAGVDGPTVIAVPGGTWHMVARVREALGATRLAHFTSTDGGASWAAAPEPSPVARLDLFASAAARSDAADGRADEIAAPALVAHNGAYQLYYSERRGTRWSIHVLASDDLVYWRDVADGEAAIAASGSGFDSFSVTDPAVVAGDTVELFYAGSDGARVGLGHASRSSATHRSGELAPP